MELIKPKQHIPNDIVKILLQFDGRIKYRNGHYINTIDHDDKRYAMLGEIVKKKLEIYRDSIKDRPLHSNCFIYYIYFNNLPHIKLTYVYVGATYFYDGSTPADNYDDSQFTVIFGKRNNNMIFIRVANWQFT